MLTLYSFLLLMLLIALGIFIFPFLKTRQIKSYMITAVFLGLISFLIYHFTGNKQALLAWLNEGQNHYRLLETFEELGGVDGAIKRIEQKLQQNPKDSQGWFILGKLYLANHEDDKAQQAFDKAKQLK